MKRRNRHTGFTLVELLVVLLIIGILASTIAVISLRKLNRSRQSRAMEDMRQINQRIAMVVARTGRYPSEMPGIGKAEKQHDPWGNLYVYTCSEDGEHFALRCCGKDGIQSEGITPETRNDFDLDIIMKDGHFIHEPFSDP